MLVQLDKYRNQFLKGDNEALKQIYIEHHDDIIRILERKNICTKEEAEGFLTEAMIQFYESVSEGKLKEVKSLKNYIIGICINLKKRDNDGKLKIEKKVEEVRLHLYNNYDYKLTESYNKELIAKVKFHLSKLSKRCRDIIVAYYINSLTMKEVANYLDLSSGDVAKTLKSRCYKLLLKSIKSDTV